MLSLFSLGLQEIQVYIFNVQLQELSLQVHVPIPS